MFFRLAPIFVVLLALLAFSAEARPQRGTLKSRRLTPEERSLTNSERLARGLPPRAPALNRLLPGREPTPAYKRGGSSASPSPSPSPSGSASVSVTCALTGVAYPDVCAHTGSLAGLKSSSIAHSSSGLSTTRPPECKR